MNTMSIMERYIRKEGLEDYERSRQFICKDEPTELLWTLVLRDLTRK